MRRNLGLPELAVVAYLVAALGTLTLASSPAALAVAGTLAVAVGTGEGGSPLAVPGRTLRNRSRGHHDGVVAGTARGGRP